MEEPGESRRTEENEHVKAVVFRQYLGTEQQSSIGDFTGNHELVVTDFT